MIEKVRKLQIDSMNRLLLSNGSKVKCYTINKDFDSFDQFGVAFYTLRMKLIKTSCIAGMGLVLGDHEACKELLTKNINNDLNNGYYFVKVKEE